MTVLLSFEEKKTVDVRACPKFGHCPFNIDAIKKKNQYHVVFQGPNK